MVSIHYLLHIVTSLDSYLGMIVEKFGTYSYLIIFFMIFSETGFVVTPFVPADSVLFATGVLAAMGELNIILLFIGIYLSTVIADAVNYYIGNLLGENVLKKKKTFLIKKEHIRKASNYYDNYGSVTVIMARFIPVVKTFIPFAAGIAKMKIQKFILYNIIGAGIWILLFLGSGFFLGGYKIIQDNLFYVVIISKLMVLIPGSIILLKEKRDKVSNREKE